MTSEVRTAISFHIFTMVSSLSLTAAFNEANGCSITLGLFAYFPAISVSSSSISERHPRRPFQVRREAERVWHGPSSAFKSSHDAECIPTECILHLSFPIGTCQLWTTTVSSSVTARFSSLPLPSTTTVNSPDFAGLPAFAAELSMRSFLLRFAKAIVTLSVCSFGVTHIPYEILVNEFFATAEADDLVQEVFLYIHRKSGLFDSTKGSARSWIVQVAYTQALLRRRYLKSHGFYSSAIADKLPETVFRPNSGAEYDQTVEGLFGRNGWRKIETLTGEQRETFEAAFSLRIYLRRNSPNVGANVCQCPTPPLSRP